MNCGLSNLATLKGHLLAASITADTQFDAVIAAIGNGVAGLFDSVTNRKLAWKANDEAIFTGNRDHYVLPRYPVASVASVSTRWAQTEAWAAQAAEPLLLNSASGMIHFTRELGSDRTQVKVVYSGGYYFETLEPADEGYGAAAPEGAIALPGDLLSAFLLQCEQAWAVHDKLGTGVISGDGSQLSTLDLVPAVKQILAGRVRYNIA